MSRGHGQHVGTCPAEKFARERVLRLHSCTGVWEEVGGEARRDVTEGSPAAVVALGARDVMARHRPTSELPRAECLRRRRALAAPLSVLMHMCPLGDTRVSPHVLPERRRACSARLGVPNEERSKLFISRVDL